MSNRESLRIREEAAQVVKEAEAWLAEKPWAPTAPPIMRAVVDLNRALLAQLDAVPADRSQGWRAIEDAPKDGTRVLMRGRALGCDVWGSGYWFAGDDGSSGWITSAFHSQPSGFWGSFTPDGWMPLPPVSPQEPR